MKICSKCGFENVDADTFCAKCSAALLGQSVQQGESGDFFSAGREKRENKTMDKAFPDSAVLSDLPALLCGGCQNRPESWLMLGLPLLIPAAVLSFIF